MASTPMTNDQIAAIKRDYDRDGFVILRGYLREPALDDLRERATRLADDLRQRPPKREGPDRRGSVPRPARRFGDVFKGLQDHDAWFDHALKAGTACAVDQGTHRRRARAGHGRLVHQASRFDGRDRTPPRCDRPTAGPRRPGQPSGSHSISADPENGCLHYGRGSHRHELGYGIPIPGFDMNDGTAMPANVQPGDAVIHSSLTVHWSGINPTNRPRRAVSFFYWGASNQTPEQVDEILARWRARKGKEQRSWA